MASTAPVPLTTARGPLLIRARLSTHDDTDSDISPLYSDNDDTASDPAFDFDLGDTMTVATGTTALETASSVGFGRGIAVPVAKISGDEEEEDGGFLQEDDGDRDWPLAAAVARVVSTQRSELNFVDDDGSDDGFFQAADIAGTSEGTNDRKVSSWTNTEVQDEKLDTTVVSESPEVQSYSLEGHMYDRNGYNVTDSHKNSVISDNLVDRETRFEPEFDTVEGSSTRSVPPHEDASNEKIGENTLFRADDANYKLVGAEDGDTKQYKFSKDRVKGTVMTDGIYFDEATDNESSITTVNFDEEKLNENEGDETVEFDPAALAALIRQATGAPAEETISITPAPDGTRLFSDRALPADASPVYQYFQTEHLEENQADESPSASCDGFVDLLTEDGKKVHEKINSIRVKFIQLVNQLGLSIEENKTASELLNRLTVAESLKLKTWLDDAKILEKAKRDALCLDDEGNDLKFSCTILVIGKKGVGKSALINSIFKNEMTHTNAFDNGTNRIREIFGVIDGVVLRVIDTPGLSTSIMDQCVNRKLLSSIKRHVKKHPPDVVLYVDRVDLQTRNFNDIPILTSITETLGRAVWKKVVRALTHAGSAPPEGPSGAQLNYETYIAQQVHATQRAIHIATQDMTLSNPVALVENHASCSTNQGGERVLPNGIAWRPNLLLLCYSVKIMSEVYSELKPDDRALSDSDFGIGVFRIPLQFYLSSLLRSRPHLKLTSGIVELDYDFEELSYSDLEKGEDEYDTLPPFRPLKKSDIEKLSREQKKVYFEEYKYRIRLFENKQQKEVARRSKEMKRDMSEGLAAVEGVGNLGEEQGAAKSVHINDLALPPTFDGDRPSYLYRSLENNNSRVHVQAVSDAQGWDHDCGLNGVIVENSPVLMGRFPASAWVQLKKNKEEFSIHLDSSICAKHGEAGSTLTNLEIQKFENCTACIFHAETRLKNLVRSSTTGGISVAFSGDMVSTGCKIANQAHISKHVTLTGTTGMVHAKAGTIYGCNLEAQIRSKDYPVGQSQSSIELNLVKLKDILSMGANFKTQLEVSSGSNLSVNLGIDNKRTGHLSVNLKSSEQTQIAILGLISLGAAILNKFRTHSSNPSAGGEILQ